MKLSIIYDPPELQDYLVEHLETHYNQTPSRYITEVITFTAEYLNKPLPRNLSIKLVPKELQKAIKGLYIPMPNLTVLIVRADEEFTINLIHELVHEFKPKRATWADEEDVEKLAQEIYQTYTNQKEAKHQHLTI